MISHGDTGTPITTPPATARMTKPAGDRHDVEDDHVLERERVGDLQRPDRTRSAAPKPRPSANAPQQPDRHQRERERRRGAAADAAGGSGRRDLSGCWRSRSQSRMSFITYAPLATQQKKTNASAPRSRRPRHEQVLGEDQGGEEDVFFDHCVGRRSRTRSRSDEVEAAVNGVTPALA